MTALTPIRTKAETALMAQFEALRSELPNGDTGRGAREAAMAAFAAKGLPHRRVEAYHYTDLRNLLREAAPLAHSPSTKAGRSVEAGRFMGDLGAHEIIFVNGRLMDGSSLASKLPPGVTIRTSADTAPTILDPNDAVVALNTALARETVTLEIGDGVAVERPLHFAFIQDAGAPQAVFARLACASASGPRSRFSRAMKGRTRSRRNRISGSRSRSVKARASSMCGSMRRATRHCRYRALGCRSGVEPRRSASISPWGRCFRVTRILARFDGEEAKLRLNGVGMLDGDRHADVTLVVDHAVPGGQSRELFKTAVDDRASGVFQGKIIVRPHAQKTDGKMMSAALLLSEDASMQQ